MINFCKERIPSIIRVGEGPSKHVSPAQVLTKFMLKEYLNMLVLGNFGECLHLSVQWPLRYTQKWYKIATIFKIIAHIHAYWIRLLFSRLNNVCFIPLNFCLSFCYLIQWNISDWGLSPIFHCLMLFFNLMKDERITKIQS